MTWPIAFRVKKKTSEASYQPDRPIHDTWRIDPHEPRQPVLCRYRHRSAEISKSVWHQTPNVLEFSQFTDQTIPFCSQNNPTMAVLLAVLIGLVAGIVMMSKLDSCRRCIWRLLRALSPPTTVWRVGFNTWREEEAVGLPFLPHGCRNCDWWDAQERSQIASRMHSAMDHEYFTGDGTRGGHQVADRWVSCST